MEITISAPKDFRPQVLYSQRYWPGGLLPSPEIYKAGLNRDGYIWGLGPALAGPGPQHHALSISAAQIPQGYS